MSRGKWLNKYEVLQDLQEVCGRPSREHIYEESLTEIRDKPPTSVPCEDDEDTYHFMMGCRRGQNNTENALTEPDLPCITHWLDQVKKTEGHQSNEDLDECGVLNNRNNPVELTKLNPSVQKLKTQLDPTVEEFVPRAVNSGTTCDTISSTNIVNIGSSGNDKIVNIVQEDNEIDKKQTNTSLSNEECAVKCVQQKHSDEIQELKDKINNAPSTDSFQNRFQNKRSIALSKLMRLLTNEPVPKCKLLTPEHFVTSAPEAPEPLLQQHEVPIINVIDPEISTPISATNLLATTEDIALEQEDPSRIDESVKKVNDWFQQEEPVKEQKPTLHFAPPTYKRKEKSLQTPKVSTSMSTIRSSTSSPSTTTCKKFVPSQHADELYKKFFKDSKENTQKPVSIWESLERQLREKDNQIRQKKLESLPN